jgi:hypothetical protein
LLLKERVMDFLERAPRNLFFTGKGGVGKTSVACATAIALAERGRRVLLVSTDPASNLDEVLETPLSGEPRAVTGVPGLCALNIDPEAAAHAYRERMVGPYRGVLPDAAVRSIEEQLSGPAPSRSLRSTSSPSCSATRARRRTSITSSSTPRPQGTRCACSSCPRRGLAFSRRTSAEPRASDRSRA